MPSPVSNLVTGSMSFTMGVPLNKTPVPPTPQDTGMEKILDQIGKDLDSFQESPIERLMDGLMGKKSSGDFDKGKVAGEIQALQDMVDAQSDDDSDDDGPEIGPQSRGPQGGMRPFGEHGPANVKGFDGREAHQLEHIGTQLDKQGDVEAGNKAFELAGKLEGMAGGGRPAPFDLAEGVARGVEVNRLPVLENKTEL